MQCQLCNKVWRKRKAVEHGGLPWTSAVRPASVERDTLQQLNVEDLSSVSWVEKGQKRLLSILAEWLRAAANSADR